MTEENYNYRTNQTLLRNQFPGPGKLQSPVIPKFQEQPGDFDDLLLIGLDKTHLEDQNHLTFSVTRSLRALPEISVYLSNFLSY